MNKKQVANFLVILYKYLKIAVLLFILSFIVITAYQREYKLL